MIESLFTAQPKAPAFTTADAPCNTVLYIDKVLKGHNILQAIADEGAVRLRESLADNTARKMAVSPNRFSNMPPANV